MSSTIVHRHHISHTLKFCRMTLGSKQRQNGSSFLGQRNYFVSALIIYTSINSCFPAMVCVGTIKIVRRHNSVICRQLISNSIMYRLCSHYFFNIVCAHCCGSTGNSSGACLRSVHEELACTCCSLLHNYAESTFQLPRQLP